MDSARTVIARVRAQNGITPPNNARVYRSRLLLLNPADPLLAIWLFESYGTVGVLHAVWGSVKLLQAAFVETDRGDFLTIKVRD